MSSLQYTRIPLNKISKEHIGKKFRTFGWVETARTQKNITFVDLYAGFKKLKCVYDGKIIVPELSKSMEELTIDPKKLEVLNDKEKLKSMNKKEMRHLLSQQKKLDKKDVSLASSLTFSTSIEVFGTVKENFSKDGAEFEFHIEEYKIFGKPAPSFPVTETSDVFTKLERGHLYLRLPERRLFLKARSYLLKLIRDFYSKYEYIEVTPPTIVQTQVEGGSTLFKLDYYGEPAFLTQSSQLYLETVVPVTMKAYCAVQSYRAEKSNTRRHLSEYTHVEAELADIEFKDLQSSIEDLIREVTNKFYSDLKEDILEIYPDFEFIELPTFERMTYKEGIAFLNSKGQTKEDGTKYEIGDDIPDAAERYMVNEVGRPILLTNFLVEHKPFYMRKCALDRETTESVDLLFPGVGEIVGGSMRTESYDDLMSGFEREGIKTDPYYWYTDMMKYGGSVHGGYGLGFERLLMALMKYDSVNMACLYPRSVSRCAP